VAHRLTTRPNLEHFRGQAKTLLASLRSGDAAAARAFIAHLPKAHGMSASAARAAEFRWADAQTVIARQHGFASWPQLARHVELLRALQGEWHFDSLQVDGSNVPSGMIDRAKILMDGDRFRTESAEGNYDGRFSIDTSIKPMEIDIEFVEGPEAGNEAYGLFELDGDRLTICLGLVGASRPTAFVTAKGSGHALERLRRASAERPAGVTGGKPAATTRATKAQPAPVSVAEFSAQPSAMLDRLAGEWKPVRLVTSGDEMNPEWLPHGMRTTTGSEAKVVFGGQVMLHVAMRVDDGVTPIAIDYLHLQGRDTGAIGKGIMQWSGDDVCILMASPGLERPADFSNVAAPGLTFSQWRRLP
jgi:uncharacterized protein (TIGR03067 family)